MTSVLKFLYPLLEKEFVKNWFLSETGWAELNDLFHHFFEVEFIKDEKRRNNTLPAELIYAMVYKKKIIFTLTPAGKVTNLFYT